MSTQISGMGVVGSFIAHTLNAHTIPFTWYDKGTEHVAWRASTGTIYPSGDTYEQWAYDVWKQWVKQAEDSPLLEKGLYYYTSKSAPHGAKINRIQIKEHMSMSDALTFHTNMQLFVEQTRQQFADKRVDALDADAKTIFTHTLRDSYTWGWSAMADLSFADYISVDPYRPCIYNRPHRYQLNYIYPCPSSELYYIGTATIRQKTPQKRGTQPSIGRFEQGTHMFAEIVEIKDIMQGWRPVSKTNKTQVIDGNLHIAPQSGNGVRLAPLYLTSAANWIGIKDYAPASLRANPFVS